MAKIKRVEENMYRFRCPGCGSSHAFTCNGRTFPSTGATWSFDMNMDAPTISPSLNIAWGKQVDPNWQEPDGEDADANWSGRCHSVVTAGKIYFCSDSTHHLAGKTVDLPEI